MFSIARIVFLCGYLLLRRIVLGYHFQVTRPCLLSPSVSSPSTPSPSSPSSPSTPSLSSPSTPSLSSPSSHFLMLLLAAHLARLPFFSADALFSFFPRFPHRYHCLTLLLTSSYALVFLLRNTNHPILPLLTKPLILLLYA